MVTATVALTTEDLATLAVAINYEHRACASAISAGLEHAIRAGELLIRAKVAVPHGEWLPWLRDRFEGSTRTAQAYMRVARERSALEQPNTQHAAHLSLRAALAALAAPTLRPDTVSADQLLAADHEDVVAHFAAVMDRLAELRDRLDSVEVALPELVAIQAEASEWERHSAEVRLCFERLAGQAIREGGLK